MIELLITVSIIAIMASMVLFALYAAQEQARVQKTRSLITKLNNIVRARYESYRTRRAPIQFTNEAPLLRSKMRLDVLRDLMRMEMPDRWTDVTDGPVTPFAPPWVGVPISRPSINQAYFARYSAGTASPEHQNAECLYMIVMEAVAREGDSRDVFRPDDAADTDGDGFLEFVDAWGMPIRFLRWAPGFVSEVQTPVRAPVETFDNSDLQRVIVTSISNRFSNSPSQYVYGALVVLDQSNGGERLDTDRMARITGYTYDTTMQRATFTCETPSGVDAFDGKVLNPDDVFVVMPPDPFDSRGVYPNYSTVNTSKPTFALYPLVYSAGPDRAFGVVSDTAAVLQYAHPSVALNPFYVPTPGGMLPFGLMIGSFAPPDSGEANFYEGCWLDNIHNHQLNMR